MPTMPAMNETTPINSELLSADARGRKHIPVAVFAVILIHVVLFVVLLVAAGCRASARAKGLEPIPQIATAQTAAQEPAAHAAESAPASVPPALSSEPVVATEPVVEPEPPQSIAQGEPVRTPVQRAALKTVTRAPAKTVSTRSSAIYVVQAGDTVEKIAKRHGTSIQAIKTANNLKNHLIHPGQKLRMKPEGPVGTSPYQVKTSKPKRSNEA